MLGHLVSNYPSVYQGVPPALTAAGTLGLVAWLRSLFAPRR